MTASHHTSYCRSPGGAELGARVRSPGTGCLCQSNGPVRGTSPEKEKDKNIVVSHSITGAQSLSNKGSFLGCLSSLGSSLQIKNEHIHI